MLLSGKRQRRLTPVQGSTATRKPALRALTAVFFLLVSTALNVQAAAPVDEPTAKGPPQRNVVVIVADDLGFQIGCYGDQQARTPGLDRLAAAGTRFTRGYCTTASCSASRSVLMTGLFNHSTGHYGHAHGYNHFSTYESVPTLPVMLEEAGYRTCSIGKYHLAPDYVYRFQDYRNQGIAGARNSVRMAKNAAEWIAEAPNQPFFLYWCTSDPHRGGGPGGFSNYADQPDRYTGIRREVFDPKTLTVPPWLPDNEATRLELAEYYEAVARMDQGIDDLLDVLVATGNWENTLIVFLSDNGPPFPGAKTNLYEPGMRLPLIVRNPLAEDVGFVTASYASWVDLVPTVLDFCGVEPAPRPAVRPRENKGSAENGIESRGGRRPVRFAGRSFLAETASTDAPANRQVFASHTFHEITMYYPMRVLIDGDYKYIFNVAHQLPYPFASDLQRSPTWQSVLAADQPMYGNRSVYDYLHRPQHELYRLSDDPWELNNLANAPEHQQQLKQMQEQVREWQNRTGDPWKLKWDYE